jgi:hypothetical protein
MMEITDAQAEGDAAKVKAMRTCVGWFSSPACALIYQVTQLAAAQRLPPPSAPCTRLPLAPRQPAH